MDISRRTLLKAGGLVAAGPVLATARAQATPRAPRTVTMSGTAFGAGQYLYHPFAVPPGIARVEVAITKSGAAKTGLGLFDQRGSHYATLQRPNGFRGIYGEERDRFFVSAAEASQSFIPGPIEPGEWTVVVPVFQAEQPTPYTVTVTMTPGPRGKAFSFGADLEVVRAEPGWYRGDLHAHTPESSDAWKSGSALTPRQWADECRRIGLDFLALTDHNVVTQNFDIVETAGEGVLLMAGEEMTNWFYGHATVSGIAPGDWLDWRQLPGGSGGDPRSGSIQEFLEAARATGAYVSAAHPLGATLAWKFFPEAAVDPAARTDGLEVWTGQFQPDDEAVLALWDRLLVAGERIVGNGGSDLHGQRNDQGFASGTPTTVVHADALSKRAVVAALKAGRSFITRRPDGVEVYLSGTGVDGQRQIMGGTLYGAPTDLAELEVVVRRAGGMRLVVIRDGAVVSVQPIASDDETVAVPTPIGAGGYVRVEVRGVPEIDPAVPLAGRTDLEALTNPLWLVAGPPPGVAADPTQPLPLSTAPVRKSAGLAPVAGGVTAAALTISELRLRASTGDTLRGAVVGVMGEATAVDGAAVTLTRWVAGCCSGDEPVSIVVLGVGGAKLGRWYDVDGVWVAGTTDPPQLRATAIRPVTDPPTR